MSRGNPRISFRVPEPVYDELERRAEEVGLPLGSYARSLVLDGLGAPRAGKKAAAPARRAAAADHPQPKSGPRSTPASGPDLAIFLCQRARIPLAVAKREVNDGRARREAGELVWGNDRWPLP